MERQCEVVAENLNSIWRTTAEILVFPLRLQVDSPHVATASVVANQVGFARKQFAIDKHVDGVNRSFFFSQRCH